MSYNLGIKNLFKIFMNKKTIISIIVLIVIVGIIFFNGDSNVENKSLKVGVILPLSGQYGAIGESIRDAIMLAADADEDIEVIFEDDSYEAKKTLSAYMKLTSIDNVDALLTVTSPGMSVIQPLVDEEEILVLHLTESDLKADDSVFQMMPFSYPLFTALGEEAANRYERVALIYGNIDIFVTNSEYFEKGIGSDKIIHRAQISSDSDLRTEMTKVLASNPDAVTMIVDKDTGVKILRTLNEQKGDMKVDVICDANTELALEGYVEALGSSDFLEGCISTNLPNNMTEGFKAEFVNKYDYNPTIASDFGYDAISILSNLKSISRDKWIKEVKKTNFNGVSGEVRFDENGTRSPEFELHILKDGEFVELK